MQINQIFKLGLILPTILRERLTDNNDKKNRGQSYTFYRSFILISSYSLNELFGSEIYFFESVLNSFLGDCAFIE